MNNRQNLATARLNANLALAATFFNGLAFILPIWLLYSLNELNLAPTTSIVVFMSIWVTSGLLEIPTGALADRLGRKKIFTIGNALLLLYPLAYAFKLPLLVILAACLVSALGNALQSGALTPIVYSSYKRAGLDKESYNKFLSTRLAIGFIARITSGITGAYLYSINPVLPFYAIAGATLLNILLAQLIKTKNEVNQHETNKAHIVKTLSIMKTKDTIIAIFVVYISFSFIAEAIWTGYQVFFEADGRSEVAIGAIFSVIAGFSAVGAYTIRYLNEKHNPFRLFQLHGLGTFATAVLLLQPNLLIRLFSVIPLGFVSGITIFIVDSTIQHAIDEKYHSTALSVGSFMQYVTYALGSLFVGILLQIFGISTARLLLTIVSIMAFTFVYLYLNSRSKLTKLQIVG